MLGAGLVTALRERFPGCSIEGVGGELMRSAGMTLWDTYDQLAVMGIAEVLKHLPRLLKYRRRLFARISALKPDAFIGIDGPDFNLGLERRLKRAGVKTVHYVSPSIWAWREGRANKIKKSAERVLCLFPMEPPIYDRYGMASTYLGHPLANTFAMEPDASAARATLGIDASGRWLGILPGSRLGEIYKLGRVFLQAALLVWRAHPEFAFVVPMANARCREAFSKVLDGLATPQKGDGVTADAAEWARLCQRVTVVDGRSHEVMIASDVILLASGTAALEAMLAKRPMVVAYKVAPMTARIVRALGILKINRYSLPNILADDALVPELIQEDCTAANIAKTLLDLIDQPALQARQVDRFHGLHTGLIGNGSAGAAQAIAEVIGV